MRAVYSSIFSLLLLISPAVHEAIAAQYFVSPTGSDSASGSLTDPLKTPQRAAALAVAGDTIYLRAGLYRIAEGAGGPIVFANAGANNSAPITMAAYPGEAPVISGMLDRSDPSFWAVYSDDIYTTTNLNGSEFDGDIQLVVQDDKVLQQKSSLSSLTAPGQVYFDRSDRRLYVKAVGGGNPGLYRLEVGQSDRLFQFFPSHQYVVLENLALSGGYYGIQCEPGGGHRTFRKLTMKHFRNDAVKFNTTGNHDDLVELCKFSSYGDFGIDSYGSSNQVFRYNEFTGIHPWRGGGGIKTIAGSNHHVIEGNYIHDLGGLGWAGGLELRESQYIDVMNNLIAGTQGPGINIYGDNATISTPVTDPASRWISIVNNTIYHTKLPGIWLSKACANITVRNNIIFQMPSDSSNLRVEIGAELGFSSDYNDFFRQAGSPVKWLSTTYALGRYGQLTQQDLHSFANDPHFIDPSRGDFHLASDSPAIDRGTSAGAPALDADQIPRPQGLGFDLGAYEYQAGF